MTEPQTETAGAEAPPTADDSGDASAPETGDEAERPKRTATKISHRLIKPSKLRFEAGIAYMTDPNSPTLAELARDPRFHGVSRKTLERWAKLDRWVERRTAFFEKISEKVRNKLSSKLCQIQQRDLDDLEVIRNKAIELLSDPEVQPKSWEGVAKVMMEATSHRERIALAIGKEISPSDRREELKASDVGLMPEELQVAAREILRFRRGAHQLGDGAPALDGAEAGVVPPAPTDPPLATGTSEALAPSPITIDTQFTPAAPEPPAAPSEARAPLSLGLGDEDDDEGLDARQD